MSLANECTLVFLVEWIICSHSNRFPSQSVACGQISSCVIWQLVTIFHSGLGVVVFTIFGGRSVNYHQLLRMRAETFWDLIGKASYKTGF